MTDTLRLISPFMHGPAVRRLQEFGDLLGFDYGDNDGVFGPLTELAVIDMQRKLELKQDGVCGPETWKAIMSKLDEEPLDGVEGIFDRRGLHKPPKLYAKQRSWEDIAGITLHQTGCQMPLAPRGWDRLNAHIGITRDGKVVIVNDPTDMIWHAQRLSHRTIGIEISGNFAGVDGIPSTVWKGGGGPDLLNWRMLEALDLTLDWLIEQFSENGQRIQSIYAHRQSAQSRIADPGSAIWRKVAIPWMRKLGISTTKTVADHFGNGRRIPFQWNPLSSFTYREQPPQRGKEEA